MRQAIAVAAVLAIAACSEIATGPQGPQGEPGPQGPAGTSSHQSGSRIKARVGRTPDGAKSFLGWHDTERDENCTFGRAEDGATRCLPFQDSSITSQLFSDSNCTNLVGAQPACLQAKRYLARATGPCYADLLYVIYEAAPLPDDAELYRHNEYIELESGQLIEECIPWQRIPGEDYLYATAKVPAAEFQVMTETVE